MRRTVLTLLHILVLLLPPSCAFAPVRATLPHQGQPHHPVVHSYNEISSTRLYETKKENDVEEMHDTGVSSEAKQARKPMSKLVRQVLKVIDLTWSYTILFFGTLVTLGIVLNLCGFAYSISLNDGLTIDTIQHVREENQFAAEMERMKRDDYHSTLPR